MCMAAEDGTVLGKLVQAHFFKVGMAGSREADKAVGWPLDVPLKKK